MISILGASSRMNQKISITGITGFVGRALLSELDRRQYETVGVARSISSVEQENRQKSNTKFVGEINSKTDWSDVLDGTDCVIHCAARAHVMNERESDSLAAYCSVNVYGTERLAEAAAAAGVRRFIYLSSIKVNGEETSMHDGFSAYDNPAPQDPYGLSKWEAELALRKIADRTGLEVVIVRPPLVYGPGVKGNLLRLLGLIHRGVPLPVASIQNSRSMIGLDNLVDLLIHCIHHPEAPGSTFLVSDEQDLSTPDLCRKMSEYLGRPNRLMPIPVSLLRAAGRILSKQGEVERLTGSLRVDGSVARDILNWKPPVTLDDGLQKMSSWYLERS